MEEPRPHSACTQGVQQWLLEPLRLPHCLPIAREIDISLENINFFFSLFRNVPLLTKLLPGKVSQAGILSPLVEKPSGSASSWQLGQGDGETSDGLFQIQISDLSFPHP